MAQSDPTYLQGAARSGEVAAADWTGGCNKAASNANGIGIATGQAGVSTNKFTLLDQNGAARSPQQSSIIGGSAANILVTDNDSDHNDTVSLTSLSTGWVKNAVA